MKFEYWSYDCKSFQTYDLDESAAEAFPLAADEAGKGEDAE